MTDEELIEKLHGLANLKEFVDDALAELLSDAAEAIETLLDRVETADQALQRVREQHQWNRVDQYDGRLGDWVEEYCTGCHEVWPCATIRALEGDDA